MPGIARIDDSVKDDVKEFVELMKKEGKAWQLRCPLVAKRFNRWRKLKHQKEKKNVS